MKTNARIVLALALAGSLRLNYSPAIAGSPGFQDGGFTYQGVLKQNGVRYNGTADLEFRLYDGPAGTGATQIGPTLAHSNQAITDGTSNTLLIFEQPPPAPPVWNGQERWLEVRVRTPAGSANPFVALTPWQKVTTAPYAAYALNASLPANYGNAVNFSNPANAFAGSGAGLSNLNATSLTGLISSVNLAGTYSGPLNLSNTGNVYAGSGAGLTNINASNITTGTLNDARLSASLLSRLPDAGTVLGKLSFGDGGVTPYAVAVSGNIACVVENSVNLMRTLDVSDPTNIVPLDFIGTAASPFNIAAVGGFAYVVSSSGNSLQIFNISNPSNITLSGSAATAGSPNCVFVAGNFAYVTCGAGNVLQVFNVSIPTSPTLAGSIATATGANSVAVSGNTAFVTCSSGAVLQAFNVSNPAAITLAGSVPTGVSPRSVAISGNTACVVNFNFATLQTFNVSNPASMTLLGSVNTDPGPIDVAVSGTIAIVSNINSETIQAVDISVPASPTLASRANTGETPRSIVISGDTAYVAETNAGLIETFSISGLVFDQGAVYASGFNGSGENLTNLNAYSITTGVLGANVLSGPYTNPLVFNNAANLFTGNGAGLTSLNASNVSAGNLASARLPTGGAWNLDTLLNVEAGALIINPATQHIGLGALVPAARLHITDLGPIGVIAPSAGDTAILERSGENYLQMYTPDANESGILFGQLSQDVAGGILFNSDVADGLDFRTGGNTVRMAINNVGGVGIGTTGHSIDAVLHVQSDAARAIKVDRYTSDGELLAWARDDSIVGSVTVTGGVVAYGAFTGVHYAQLEDDAQVGELVSLTGSNVMLGNRTDGETVYGVQTAKHANDPAVLGVYIGSLHGADYNHPRDLAQVAALGNGDLWIVDTGSPIEPGDYLIASDVPGCAMKDDPRRFAVGNVIARAASRVDWSDVPTGSDGSRRVRISVLFGNFVRGTPQGDANSNPGASSADSQREIASLRAANAALGAEVADIRRLLDRLLSEERQR